MMARERERVFVAWQPGTLNCVARPGRDMVQYDQMVENIFRIGKQINTTTTSSTIYLNVYMALLLGDTVLLYCSWCWSFVIISYYNIFLDI